MDEQKKAARAIEKTTTNDNDIGNTPKATTIVEQANTAAERMETATQKMQEQLDRQEALYAKQQYGGRAEASQVAEAPKRLTDTEYAEALERGEVNPMKEDGYK